MMPKFKRSALDVIFTTCTREPSSIAAELCGIRCLHGSAPRWSTRCRASWWSRSSATAAYEIRFERGDATSKLKKLGPRARTTVCSGRQRRFAPKMQFDTT